MVSKKQDGDLQNAKYVIRYWEMSHSQAGELTFLFVIYMSGVTQKLYIANKTLTKHKICSNEIFVWKLITGNGDILYIHMGSIIMKNQNCNN